MTTEQPELLGREVGWLARSLAVTCAAGLTTTVLAGLVQVRFGAYEMTFLQVVDAVLDPLVWLRPQVLARFLLGDGFAGALGMRVERARFLDLRHQLTVRTLNADRGVTVGVVRHDITQAARYADTLIAIQDGELYDSGPPADVVTEELLADVFGVDATVREGLDGLEIVPRRPLE
jgi:hypothetical protein